VIQHLSMAYLSHHYFATLLCSSCINFSLLVFVVIYVLLSDMCLCSLLILFLISCTLHASAYINHTQQQPSSLLCSVFSYSLCTFCIPHAQCLDMLFKMSLFFPIGFSLQLFLTPAYLDNKKHFTSLFFIIFSHRVIS
jgi:hypothetical protein